MVALVRSPALALAAATAALALPGTAPAAVIDVTSQADNNGAGCTLREAITSANAAVPSPSDGCTDGGASDEVVLPASANPWVLTQTGAGDDDNETGDLDVRDN